MKEVELTAEKIKTIFENLPFDADDATVTTDLVFERSRQGELTMRYGHIWAQAGRMRQKVERQLKRVRAKVELEFRTGEREIEIKITEGAIKAMVEIAEEVEAAEEALAEATYWYNVCANYDKAIMQRMDLIRYLHQEQNRNVQQYG